MLTAAVAVSRTIMETETDQRAKRTALLSKALCVRADGAELDVRIRNLSSSGLGGVAEFPLVREERVLVDIKGIGEIEGRVAWTRGASFGMIFDKPADLTKFEVSKPFLPKFEHHSVMTRFRPVTAFKRPGFTR